MKICFLEQGKEEINNLKYKSYLHTDQSQFYRLNWFTDNDLKANWTIKDIKYNKVLRFTEGREFLYMKAKEFFDYDYYIFIDEDIDFYNYKFNTQVKVVNKIIDFLKKYKPVAGHIMTRKIWSWNEEALIHMRETNKPISVSSHDVCTFIYSKNFATMMFPLKEHGSGSALWYHQWLLSLLFPDKYLLCPNVYAVNAVRKPHFYEDDRKKEYRDKITSNFLNLTFAVWQKQRQQLINIARKK